MEKVPGCWEHLSMVWWSLKEACKTKANLATVWLDITNAYGYIPHKLIISATLNVLIFAHTKFCAY